MDQFQISLAAARVNAGLTQGDVAERMHVGKQTVLNWEKGNVIPKPAQLEMMCRMYGCPLDAISLPPKST